MNAKTHVPYTGFQRRCAVLFHVQLAFLCLLTAVGIPWAMLQPQGAAGMGPVWWWTVPLTAVAGTVALPILGYHVLTAGIELWRTGFIQHPVLVPPGRVKSAGIGLLSLMVLGVAMEMAVAGRPDLTAALIPIGLFGLLMAVSGFIWAQSTIDRIPPECREPEHADS